MQGTLKIHSENILPIIKRWLYSEKEIFIRELISNSCDAIKKLSFLQDNKEARSDAHPFRIDVKIDATKRTLTFSDNGLGMDGVEVEKYIAQIAFSGAEEFLQKYQTKKEEDQIIGHFGMGFYSAYMVAEKVEIQSLSYKADASAIHWICDGSSNYTLEAGVRQERGTDVILTLAKDEDEFLDAMHLKKLLTHYCSFLPYPIYLNDSLINEKPPLWVKPASECTDKEYLDFYRLLFPFEPEPLFWVHLNVDYPFHLKGILYFPPFSKENDWSKASIKLFCNRVFVSENCKDLLPDYLMILRGAIDSSDIPLNVSRSALQTDKTVKQVGFHISKKISDRLSALYRSEQAKFYEYWKDIEIVLKYGALQDEKFYERIKEFLIWKNSAGAWTTIEDYLERNKPKTENTIYYALDTALSPTLDLYTAKGIEVLLISPSRIDQAMIHLLEQKTDAKFQRIDAAVADHILDPSKEKNLLDADGKSESAKIAEFFRKQLLNENIDVEAKSLASDSLPALLMIKEEERRFRDSMAFLDRGGSHALVKPTFIINTNHSLIQAIRSLEEKDPSLANEMTLSLYHHTLLSHQELDPKSLPHFLSRNLQLLEKLALIKSK